MNKQIKWGAIILMLVLIAGMILYPKLKPNTSGKETAAKVPSPGKGSKDKILNINAIVLKYQTLSDKIVSTGNIIPDEEVDLSFESSGKVTNIYFEEGTHVKKGDLLAKINDKPLQAQLKKLQAEIPLAEDRLYRQKTLLARDAVSQEAFEQVSTENEKLKADIELVKAN
ncbi:MAG: biotin/lipoyl-binding protein, partial [Bacteroidales bacterium]|nr:biotin/lipoyl-binding protein [Bacteroidales bacterium]